MVVMRVSEHYRIQSPHSGSCQRCAQARPVPGSIDQHRAASVLQKDRVTLTDIAYDDPGSCTDRTPDRHRSEKHYQRERDTPRTSRIARQRPPHPCDDCTRGHKSTRSSGIPAKHHGSTRKRRQSGDDPRKNTKKALGHQNERLSSPHSDSPRQNKPGHATAQRHRQARKYGGVGDRRQDREHAENRRGDGNGHGLGNARERHQLRTAAKYPLDA